MPIPAPSMSRLSTSSPVPPSPRRTNIPRPSSAASVASTTRMMMTGHERGEQVPPVSATVIGEPEIRNVRVVLRVRPAGSTDTSPPRQRNILVHPTSSTDVRIDVDPAALMGQSAPSKAAKRHPSFTFDQVLDQQASQADLYDATARDIVDEYLKGHNITFLAYGQTSSGKSYSMGTTGEDMDYHGTEFIPRTGLIPRTVKAIFDQAEAVRVASGPGASWECRLCFLELYNEEIIDLLSGSGVQIAIREERDGRIIWSGVKEVPVRSLAEVMHYLQDGSTKRKTGETGMNATSSRSHAIFSLTLTQKRRSSVSTSPTTPTMKRPVSYANLPPRAGTPTKGAAPPVSLSTRNSGIPTGIASAIPRSSSVMSMREDETVVVTSKFNMVDLAGSERLKRTAAQGERMREGISINSGLSALGNVISALSDPIKAKGHIPYRDSKLTRMLQDSIGGNALTTMIACVSPVEYNIAETLNTIKYASRARNIKNVAKINAVEAGWDDVEHLQNTVLKLRKRVAQIEAEGGSIVRPAEAINKDMGISQEAQRQSEKLIQRLAELQKEHTDLYDRYLAKCNDNMRLTSELRATVPGDADALAKFNETVEPVILEYEKVVNALNVQLEDLRSQLSLMDTLYEEQGGALGEAQQAQTQAESYVEELRARVGKLNERNSSSEVYINDLEAKLKGYSETEQSASDSTLELRNQITKLRESNKSLTHHANEIEARLSQADDRSSKLAQQVEELEKDLQRRDVSYKELEERIVLLDTSNDNKALLAELEGKNSAIAELERKLEDAARHTAAKDKLEQQLESERATLADLQAQLTEIGRRTPSSKGSLSASNLLEVTADRTPPCTPGNGESNGDSLQAALEAMKARVEAAEERYYKAEERIADLSAQLAEAQDEINLPISPAISNNADDELEDTDLLSAKANTPTPSPNRRGSLPILSTIGFARGGNGSGFRGGRGHGESKTHYQISSSASMGHLGQRPLSLAAMASHKTAVSALSTQRARPQSLSQELSSAQRSLGSLRSSWTGNSLLFGQGPHTAPAQGSKSGQAALRTPQSIEAELKFVHRVIEERDTELRHKDKYIRNLEHALSFSTPNMDANGDSHHPSHTILSRSPSANLLRNAPPIPSFIPLPDSPTLSPANPDISLPSSESVESLSGLDTPATPAGTVLPPIVAVTTPSNEVVDPMSGDAPLQQLIHDARDKESSHRHIIEQQFVQIADLQKANHTLRVQLAGGYPEVYRSLVKVQAERDSLLEGGRTPTRSAPSSAPLNETSANALREEHALEVQALITGHVQAMQELEAEHEAALQSARSAVFQTSDNASKEQQAILDRIAAEHASLVTELKSIHAKAMADLQQEAEAVQSEINTALLDSEEHRRQLKLKVDQAVFELSRVKDEHSITLHARQQQVLDLERTKGDLETAISSLQDAKADVDARVMELQKDKDEWLNHLVELQNTISDLTRRNAELETSNKAAARKTAQHPPQGPPPNMPLPPTPLAAPGTPLSPTFRTSTPLTLNRSGSAGSHASLRGLGIGIIGPADASVNVSDADLEAAVNLLPPHLGQLVLNLQKQREDAVKDGDRMRKVSETGRMSIVEAESNLVEQAEKAQQLMRELADARKTNSKLRAHLEDARQDNRRISDENRDYLSELNERRSQLTKIDEVKRAERESLLAANQQVAKLKAQLQQASDGKISKKTGGLRCF